MIDTFFLFVNNIIIYNGDNEMKLKAIHCILVLAVLVVPGVGDKVDDLISKLGSETDSERSAAAYSLGWTGDSRAVDPLIEALDDENWSVRSRAANSLGDIGDSRAVGPLIETLDDEDSAVRFSAVGALGSIGDPRGVEPLIEALHDEDFLVRSHSAEVLGGFGDSRAVDPLIEALDDENSTVRSSAIIALGAIGDSRAIDPIIEALDDENQDVQSIAATALRWFGDSRAIDPLIEALDDEEASVRFSAALSLAELGDSRAVDPLIEALDDPDFSIRSSAAVKLGEIGDSRAIQPLIKALDDEDPMVRSDIAVALGNLTGAGECQWDSYTPDRAAYAGQPGNVLPLKGSPFAAGSYIVLVGAAGEDGLDLPPKSWNAFGPYEIKAGHKYKASIKCQGEESLLWEEDTADLLDYSDPGPDLASVYARNDCSGEVWFAICLRSLSLSAGKTSEAGDELAKDDCHQQEEPLAIGRCFYAKARDLLKAEEYDRAIRIYEYIIQILSPVQEDMTAQGLPFSDLTILLANSWLSKGDALAMQDKYEDAIQAYDEAIRLDSGSRYYLYREAKAAALEKLGRADEARQYFDEANRIKQGGGWE